MIEEEITCRYVLCTIHNDKEHYVCVSNDYDAIKIVFNRKVDEWKEEYKNKEIDNDDSIVIKDNEIDAYIDKFNKLDLLC